MDSHRIISADSHVFEPPDLWTSRIEPKFKERAPRVDHQDGEDWWFCDGLKILSTAAGGTQIGMRFDEPESLTRGGTVENIRPGAYIPEEHVKDMDMDGVDVSVVYPGLGLLLYIVPDSELLTALFSAYNDWVSEFCNAYPKRIKGIAMLNVDDVREAVMELERCAGKGLIGALITVYPPEERSYDSLEYESLWAAAQDLGIPLSLHFATNRPGPGQEISDIDDVSPDFVCNVDHWVRTSMAKMIFSGVFQRYPELQVGSVEHELSWVPHFLDRLDYTYTQRPRDAFRRGYWDRYTGDMLPRDYFHRNMFVGFQEDALGVRDRHIIGVDNLQWGSDYPHPESTFPKSREILEEILGDCTAEEKAKIAGGNAARIYNLD